MKSLDIVAEKYNPIVKMRKNKSTGEVDTSFPPSIALSVPKYDGEWKVEIFDDDDVKLFPSPDRSVTPLTLIPANQAVYVTVIMECNSIWVVNGNFGLKWKVSQIFVPKQKLEENSIKVAK